MEQSERTGISVVKAQVPLAEMSDYVTVLRSMTQGQGVATLNANSEESTLW